MYSREMSKTSRDWAVAIGYVALIYSTLEAARIPLSFLRSHGMLRISIAILAAACVIAVVACVIHRHGISLWRFALLAIVGGAYYRAAQTVKTPEELIHFFEYGLVGVFFLRAVSHHIRNYPVGSLSALALASLAGWIDELLQGLMPNRHYDLHDVSLNAISALLGLVVMFVCRPLKSHR